MDPARFEPASNTTKCSVNVRRAVKGAVVGAPVAPPDPDLQQLIAAWPDLPPAIRAGVLAMIHAVGQ